MGKVVLGALLGMFVTILGVVLSFAYLLWMEDGGNILLLPLGIILFGTGIFLLYKFGRIDVFKPKFKETVSPAQGGVLQRNSKIISEWNQTEDKKEKLKLLKMASAAEEAKNA